MGRKGWLSRTWPLAVAATLAASALGPGRVWLARGTAQEGAGDRAPQAATGQGGLAPLAPSLSLARLPASPVFLPVLDLASQGLACQSLIKVQNLGRDPVKAILLVWGDAGACPPLAPGPSNFACTGLLRPGASWLLSAAQIPEDARSATL